MTGYLQCSVQYIVHFPTFSRELDLTVYAALQYEPVSRTLLDSDMHTKEREELSLQPQQLSFLLHDLTHKLSDSLSLFGSRGLGGMKVSPQGIVA